MDSRRAKRNHLPVYRWSRYAAAAILLIGALIYLGVQQGVIPGNQIVKNETPIVPGGNKALLILEDGTQMALEQLNVGEVAHQNRSEEHTSELQSLMRISYAVFCLKKKNT